HVGGLGSNHFERIRHLEKALLLAEIAQMADAKGPCLPMNRGVIRLRQDEARVGRHQELHRAVSALERSAHPVREEHMDRLASGGLDEACHGPAALLDVAEGTMVNHDPFESRSG